jgi:hypothetical protein
VEFKKHLLKTLETTFGEKVHLCPFCFSPFAWETAPKAKKENPVGSWRLRKPEDRCNCLKYKRMARNPQPKIEFFEEIGEDGEKVRRVVITPVKRE